MPSPTLALALCLSAAAAAQAEESPWIFQRVGGDLERTVVYEVGVYRSGDARVDTPLPDGYPRPTPPGAIELKVYPVVRRAEISGTMNADVGMNMAFYPLFLHIQRRDIAMTAPVEVDYTDWPAPGEAPPARWTMSFLYRSPDMGAPGGAEQGVTVRDVDSLIVLSIGVAGSPRMDGVEQSVQTLRGWLDAQSEWIADGDPRAMFYNGPMDPPRTRWSEVQIPVRRAEPAPPAPDAAPEAP